MEPSETASDTNLLAHVLVPVANPEDAEKTARALAPYRPSHVTVLHVVEKGAGVPDKISVEQSEKLAAESFATVRTVFPNANEHTAFSRDIVTAIFDVADEIEASAIAYRSRGGGRIMHFLSGDLSLKLVTQADCPVIALPRTTRDP